MHTQRAYVLNMSLKDFEQQADKKQAEAVQLEEKMNQMEKAMKELEQRYVCVRVGVSLRASVFL